MSASGTWENMSNKDRAEFIRSHARRPTHCQCCGRAFRAPRALSRPDLMAIFDLADFELEAVLKGADYPDRPALNGSRVGA